jgi:predicted dehydrogenase
MNHSSRRLFLRHAAGLAASAAAARPATVAANDRIRAGLIGCGGIGKVDCSTFLINPEVDVVAVADVDEKRLAEGVAHVEKLRDKRPDAVKDFRRIIDRKDIDIVLVTTPDHWHTLPAIYACQAGKDVYCEKPLATSVAESRAIVEAVKRNRRVLQMGTQWRSGRHYAEAVETVQSGRLGKIRQVRAWAYLDWVGGIGKPPDGAPPAGVDYDLWLGPAPERPFNPNRFHFNFRWFWDYAGGLMTDWGVHLINVGLWAMGPTPPLTVTSTGGKYAVDDNSETPDTQTSVYEFPTYTFIWEHQMLGGVGLGGRPHGLSFSGTEGTLIVDADGWELISEPKKKSLRPFVRKVDPNDRHSDGRLTHVRNFLACVRSRQQPVESAEVGHFVTTVSALGNIALRTGTKIAWDAARERVTNEPRADALLTRNYRKPWSLA